jgi:signal transduction histidine kinase
LKRAGRLSVVDTGVGMTRDEIQIAMSLFQQIDFDPMVAQDGVGLGLSLRRRIVDLHGAEMKIDGRKGAGTTVTVVFPKARLVEIGDRAA